MTVKTSITAIGSFTAALGTYAGMINAGVLAPLDFVAWEGYTINQIIWIIAFIICAGISVGLMVTSGASMESVIAELDNLAQTAMSSSDTEWERQKQYAKNSISAKLNNAKNSLLDKVKNAFSKKRDINAVLLEQEQKEREFSVIPPRRMLTILQEKVSGVKAVMLVEEGVQSQLEFPNFEEADPVKYVGQKKNWMVMILVIVAAIAVIGWNIWLTYGGSSV